MPIYEYKCGECGRKFELLIRSQSQEPHCKHCDSTKLKRLISRAGLIRSQNRGDAGKLQPVDPRRVVENMSRTYDKLDVDPGQGFSEIARQAAAGGDPRELKEAVKEAKQKENKDKTSPTNKDTMSSR